MFGITSNLGKAIFGGIVVVGFYAVGGFIVHALFRRYNPKDYKRMSLLQYSIMMFFVLSMVALPAKDAAAAGVAHQVRVDNAVV